MTLARRVRTCWLLASLLAMACVGEIATGAARDASAAPLDARAPRDAGDEPLDARVESRFDAALSDDAAPHGPLDAGAEAPDAAESERDAGYTRPSGEPIFVATGDGGWLATSCDRGRTWRVRAFSSTGGDLTHTPWSSMGGAAFGHGAFVAGFGWGAPGHILRATDGLDWSELPAGAFTRAGASGYARPTAAVAYDGRDILIYGDRSGAWRSRDGSTFTFDAGRAMPAGAEQIRQLRAFDGALVVAAVESQSGRAHAVGNFALVSEDGGASWREGTNYESGCSGRIQIRGGDIEVGPTGVIVIAAERVCRSRDRGLSWDRAGTPTGGPVSSVFADREGFVALSGARAYRSSDGMSWSLLGDLGGAARVGEWADGSYVAVDATGTVFYWSNDGVRWSHGTRASGPSAATAVRDLVVGYREDGCR